MYVFIQFINDMNYIDFREYTSGNTTVTKYKIE